MGTKASSVNRVETPPHRTRKAVNPRTRRVCDRVRLLWVRSNSSLYHRLSLNVLRETIDYISDLPPLLACGGLQIFLFSIDSKQFRPYFELRKTENYCAVLNLVLMKGDEVFMILRPVQFAVYIEGEIQLLGQRGDKEGCGIIYDKVRDCVYIFGGKTCNSESQNTDVCGSEAFRPSSLQSTPMADMLRPRSDFSICWHFELVYICGGGHSDIETFDPRTKAFCAYSVIGNLCNGPSASNGEELVILSEWAIWREKGKMWEETQRSGDFKQRAMFNNGSAVVRNGVMYFAGFNGIVGVDLMTGDETIRPFSLSYIRPRF